MIDQRVPPQQIEAEQSVLGGLMLDSEDFDEVLCIISGSEFYRDSHRNIFEAIKRIKTRNEACDLITVMDELDKASQLEASGGASYLASLTGISPGSKNVLAYCKIIKEKAVLRNLISLTSDVMLQSYDGRKTSQELIDLAEHGISRVSNILSVNSNHSCSIMQSSKEFLTNLEARIANGRNISGHRTGFPDLDQYLSGWCSEDYVILAARPSIGKTALACSFARSMARSGRKVAFVSMEMGKRVTDRMAAQESGVNLLKIRSGDLDNKEQGRVLGAVGKISQMPIDIMYASSPTETEIKQYIKRTKPDLAIIDYIGYCRCSEGGDSKVKRERQISIISSCFKSIARDYGIPVVALSQLNREIEKTTRPPKLSDLRDSGSLEQDADVVMFLHSESKEDRWRDVLIEKNRNGPCGKIKLAYLPESTEFKSFSTQTTWHDQDEAPW
jgi:replicative DNA helicase